MYGIVSLRDADLKTPYAEIILYALLGLICHQ
uniref:Transposase n=1 Tax=Heterorhabditis bacteriophora TaxID=37862 RepID=A0A1I7X5G1_HETBA